MAKMTCSRLLLMGWVRGAGLPAFPLTEEAVFTYVQAFHEGNRPPTRAAGLRRAVGFLKGLFGDRLLGLSEVLVSSRIAGCVAVPFTRERALHEAAPYTAADLEFLERTAAGAARSSPARSVCCSASSSSPPMPCALR